MRALKKALFLSCLILFSSQILIAQEEAKSATESTRAEEWKQKRLKKQSELTPFRPSKMERRLVEFEKKGFGESLGIRFWDLYGNLGGITSGASLGATIRYFRANLAESPFDVSASVGYSLKGYKQVGFQFGNILRKNPELFIRHSGSSGLSLFEKTKQTEGDFYYYADVVYRYYPQEDFYGLGNDSREEDKTDYLLEGTSYDGVAGLRFGPFVGAFLKAGLLTGDIGRGSDGAIPATEDLFDDITAPGLEEQPDFFRLAGSVFLDYRDVFGNPTKGGMYAATYAHYLDQEDSEFDFHRIAFDLRQYLPLASEQRILALRFYSSFDDATGSSRVPFYLMQTLGGSDSIRGYPEFRFRDENLFFISAEYRWVPHPIAEFVLFYDTGKVFSEMSDFDFNDLKKGYGVGFRLKSTDDTILRFDLGHSKEGLHFYFKLNASF